MGAKLKILNGYSKYLENMFPGKRLGGMDLKELLSGSTDLGTEMCDRIVHILQSSIGENDIHFRVNQVHLPNELVLSGKGGKAGH